VGKASVRVPPKGREGMLLSGEREGMLLCVGREEMLSCGVLSSNEDGDMLVRDE